MQSDSEILSATADRTRRLLETLQRHEHQLLDDRKLDSAEREVGLSAIRSAAGAADRVMSRLLQGADPLRTESSSPIHQLPEAHSDV